MNAAKGLAAAAVILVAFLAVQGAGLFLLPFPQVLLLAPVATFLFTGLFITGHDALHGTVCPGHPRVNRAAAAISFALYAAFDARKLRAAHALHHAMPARGDDPDWHASERFFPWLLRFALHYVSLRQLLALVVVGNVLMRGFGVRPANLAAVWIAPALLSAVQLFAFGTFLPHRTPAQGHADQHRATSAGSGEVWSFLACYHFGYHHEHHDRPDVPWWSLPRARREALTRARSRPAALPRA